MGKEPANGKDSFVLHIEDFEDLGELKDAEAGKLLKAVLAYATGVDIPKLGLQSKTMFGYIRRHMERDRQRYEETCAKRAAAGKKGGRPRKDASEKAKKANVYFAFEKNPDNDPDPDNDYEPEYDPDNDPEYEPEPVAPPGGGPGDESGLWSPEQKARRIKMLEILMDLYKKGCVGTRQEYQEWIAELEQLKGGNQDAS